ncbi:hypothetical protein B0H14DRAFT_2652816 [Mycena olivaceomarginata]|nr:hypothetical protein B0H14DRAFT_2652816 [Mycena olivaceomarginata]
MKFTAAFLALIPFVTALPPALSSTAEVKNSTELTTLALPIPTNLLIHVLQITARTQGNVCVLPADWQSCLKFLTHTSSTSFARLGDSLAPAASSTARVVNADFNCSNEQHGPIRNPGIPNLNSDGFVPFNDQISSFKCFFGRWSFKCGRNMNLVEA